MNWVEEGLIRSIRGKILTCWYVIPPKIKYDACRLHPNEYEIFVDIRTYSIEGVKADFSLWEE